MCAGGFCPLHRGAPHLPGWNSPHRAAFRRMLGQIDRVYRRPEQSREDAMTAQSRHGLSRRAVIARGAALAAASTVPSGWAIAQAKPLKVGLMLPYSGTFAKLGENITFAIELLIAEKGGKLGERELQIIKLDDESKPELAPQNADRL